MSWREASGALTTDSRASALLDAFAEESEHHRTLDTIFLLHLQFEDLKNSHSKARDFQSLEKQCQDPIYQCLQEFTMIANGLLGLVSSSIELDDQVHQI
jgi:hypothetical protein